jgi:hypothetical protein
VTQVEPNVRNFERASVHGIKSHFGIDRAALITIVCKGARRYCPPGNPGHCVKPDADEVSGGPLAASQQPGKGKKW